MENFRISDFQHLPLSIAPLTDEKTNSISGSSSELKLHILVRAFSKRFWRNAALLMWKITSHFVKSNNPWWQTASTKIPIH
jgi:hypothetical protein